MTMHVNAGRLKAYLDDELPPAEREQVQAHLEACEACRRQAQAAAERAAQTRTLLERLAPDRAPSARPAWPVPG